MKIDGSCHCGLVTYEAEINPEQVVVCHCTDCQSLSGTAFRTVVISPAEQFKLTGEKPKHYVKTAASGNQRVQAFCPDCGSGMYSCDAENPTAFNIRTGTATQRAELVPKLQIWCQSKLAWLAHLDSVQLAKEQASSSSSSS